MKFLSVVCPVYNEVGYIRNIIDFFINALPVEKELLIIDGGSNDGTREIVQAASKINSQVRLINNPDKFVPFALNAAIKECKGDVIVRLDAHTDYANDYFTRILECFDRTNADIVGGPMRAVGKNPKQRAVAIATSTPFGVGDSSFHNEVFEGFVDSVYLGAWQTSIFKITGNFDTEMLRNQDDEFHYRARSKGLKIYLDPRISSYYYPRNSFKSLFRQYYQYGLFKPLVLHKVSSGIRLRHLIPAAFVLYLISLPLIILNMYWILPLILYTILDLIFSLKAKTDFSTKMAMIIVYPILHFSYGAGFIKGQILLLMGKRPSI
jgi:succinoglycan biosynthesis protein ExoA